MSSDLETVQDTSSAGDADLGAQGSQRVARVVPLAVIVAVLCAMPLIPSVLGSSFSYVLQLMTVAFMWIALASSWNIIGGFAGYISLGNNVFLGIGAYLSGMLLLELGWSPFATAPLAGLVGGLVGLLVGLIALRTSGPAFIITTIAMLLMVALLFDNWDYVGGANGLSLPLPPFEFSQLRVPFFYGMFVVAVGSVVLAWRVVHSRFGLGLRAIAEDETKAEVAGINTRAHKIAAFALSGVFPAMAGALWGYSLSYLRGAIFFSIAIAAQMTLMAIIGGRGTVAGPVIGAIALVALNELAVAQFGASELNLVVTGAILVAVLLFFPAGIVGSLRAAGRLPRILDWD